MSSNVPKVEEIPERVREPGGAPPVPLPADAFTEEHPDRPMSKVPPATPATPLPTRYDIGSNGGAQPSKAGKK